MRNSRVHSANDDAENLLVIVIGWVNSEETDVRKYKDIYRQEYPVISCALTSSNIGDSSAIRRECVRTLDYGKAKLSRKSERVRLLFHVLGNTGAHFFSQFERLLRTEQFARTYQVAGVVFDSSMRSGGAIISDEFQQIDSSASGSDLANASHYGVLSRLVAIFWFIWALVSYLPKVLLQLVGLKASGNDKEHLLDMSRSRSSNAIKDDSINERLAEVDDNDRESDAVNDYPELYLFSRADVVSDEARIREAIRSRLNDRLSCATGGVQSNSRSGIDKTSSNARATDGSAIRRSTDVHAETSKSVKANGQSVQQFSTTVSEVRYVCWDATPHLKHLNEHEYSYTKNCYDFLESCIWHGVQSHGRL